jgi:hypothetical protein
MAALALNSRHTEHANGDVNGDRDDNPRVKRSRVFRLARRALSSVSDVSTHHQPSMALDAAADSSNSHTTRSSHEEEEEDVTVEQIAMPSALDGVWGMFELRRRPTVTLNGVPLVRDVVEPDSEFVFDVYYRATANASDDRMPEVVFDSDLGRANGGVGAFAHTAASHAHIDDGEDLDAVEHEYPGPSDEEREDDDERRGANRRRGDDDFAGRGVGGDGGDDDGSSDTNERRALDDADEDLFTTNAADMISDVIEREFYFGDYGQDGGHEDDYDPDDANF